MLSAQERIEKYADLSGDLDQLVRQRTELNQKIKRLEERRQSVVLKGEDPDDDGQTDMFDPEDDE